MKRREPPSTEQELMLRARALEGRSVGQIAQVMGVPCPEPGARSKGWLGQLMEAVLGADPGAGDGPDFSGLGIELKTIPIGTDGRPRETTFCCAISMRNVDREEWDAGRFLNKLRTVLWLPIVTRARDTPLDQRVVGTPVLWRVEGDTLDLLRHDWETLVGNLAAGEIEFGSHLSGKALQVRPKAADSSVRTVVATDDGAQSSKPMGFYLRREFTAEILQRGWEAPNSAATGAGHRR